jgi:hypothetical protein
MTFFENSRHTLEKISFLDIETYTGENDFLGRAYADLRGWLRPCILLAFGFKPRIVAVCLLHVFPFLD